MKKKYKIQLPKGKKVTMANIDFEDGVMKVNVELESRIELSDDDRGKIEDYLMSYPLDIDAIKAYSDLIAKSKDMIHGVISRCKKQKYEPKDGDFVFFNYGTEPTIAIYKGIHWGSAIITYASCCNMLPTTYEKTISYWVNDIRPATEEEKKFLIDQLAKINKKWNEETKQIEDVRWRAGICCLYYYINSFGDVEYDKRLEIFDPGTMYSDKDVEVIGYTDDNFYNSGNYFKTREDAEKVAEQIREMFKSLKAK